MTNEEAFEAGFRAGLDVAEKYDVERGRFGRALTDAELRKLAEFWVNPIQLVSIPKGEK